MSGGRNRIPAEVIKQGLIARIDELVPMLFPNARKDGRHWLMGDIYGAPGASLSITRHGPHAGLWSDFAGTGKGDILTLVAAGACHGDIGAAFAWSIDYLHLGNASTDDIQRRIDEAHRTADAARAKEAGDAAERTRKARGMYLAGVEFAGTPVELYLKGRGIDLARLPRVTRALRYLPDTWCAETRTKLPAMLAPYVDGGGEGGTMAVHRTYLARHPDGRVSKAALKEAKKAYGPAHGCHIPLNRGASNKPLKNAPLGEWIAVAEGIENALSAAIIRPEWRVLATGTLGNLGVLRLPPQIGGLYIIADNDTKPEPQAAFRRQLERLSARGMAFSVARPPEGIKDFNDWLTIQMQSASDGG